MEALPFMSISSVFNPSSEIPVSCVLEDDVDRSSTEGVMRGDVDRRLPACEAEMTKSFKCKNWTNIGVVDLKEPSGWWGPV